MKKLITLLFAGLLALPQLFAMEEHQSDAPRAPAFGIHGMAALQVGDRFIASHMPLANSMHAHQVIFTFSVPEEDVEFLAQQFEQNELVSLMPEPFDLWNLMDGDLTQFNSDLFAGHFERDGERVQQGLRITVESMLLVEPLTEIKNGSFYVLPLATEKALLVHKIGIHPSFDQIVEVDVVESDSEQELHKEMTLTEGDMLTDLSEETGLTLVHQLYLETQDFQ